MPFRGRKFRGFPFDEEEGSSAWSELAARHPDIAARLRQRDPAAWARKRRSPQADDFGDSFSNFDRFPFNDIPPEFREHLPPHWNRGFSSRDEARPQEQYQHPQQPHQHPQPPQPQVPPQQSTATQTDDSISQSTQEVPQNQQIPQYGLRNTVDLGQKSAADPSLVDGEDRSQRSMSAPPDTMSSPQQHEPQGEQTPQYNSKVRNIPIFVEGRGPLVNKNAETTYAAPPPPHHQPPHHQPPQDNAYFPDDGPAYIPPRNFSQAFGSPFPKTFRQPQQPFPQKVYPQSAAYARGASPGRATSPKPQHHEEIKIPVQHEKPVRPEQQRPQPKPQPPHPQQQQAHPQQQQAHPQQQQAHPQQQQSHPQQQQPPQPHQQTPPPQPAKQQPQAQDPITQILVIQTDVLNLMTEVEKFAGTKKDKQYMFLDEMLTRNLLKLDNIETDGKENIRNARKEAIRCIQKCISVLEAKADGNLNAQAQANQQPSEVEMNTDEGNGEAKPAENGEVEMKESKEEANAATPQSEPVPEMPAPPAENKENPPSAPDTQPEGDSKEDTDKKPKKGGKGGKKRDKSKETKEAKNDKSAVKSADAMQVDDKAKNEPQKMEVDGAASQ